MLKIYEIKERAKLYLDSNTFTFIVEVSPNGFNSFHNGFVIKDNTDSLVFFDVVAKKEFPAPYDKIIDIQPSAKKDMTYAEAKEIKERYYEENKNQKDVNVSY